MGITYDNILTALKKYSTLFSKSGNDYVILKIDNSTAPPELLRKMHRIEGLAIILCTGGSARIQRNFVELSIEAGSLCVFGPGDVVEIDHTATHDVEAYAIFLAPEFINNVNLDHNAIDYRNLGTVAASTLTLDSAQQKLIGEHFRLLNISARANTSDTVYTRNIARSLVSAIFYQMMAFADAARPESAAGEQPQTRRSGYVHDFMELVRAEFHRERSINYYAGRLFISPKYLSLIIKESTGYTATEWIDRHVILEAKNLLRFSGKNIQQIAYALNFSNQSSFGKYFKHQTGLSPSQFRKS